MGLAAVPGRTSTGPMTPALDPIIAEQEDQFLRRQPKSAAIGARAREVLAGGATSSWQIAQPQAVWLSHGLGSKVYDVDGTEYVDLHGGYGVSLVGHAHPAIVRAVSERMPLGTHFAAVTEDSVVVAEELVQRWGLPKWRFTNSGSESTMDAIRLARAHTGRELVIKMEGSYHGHHDTVMVSIGIDIDDDAVGPANRPNGVPYGGGIPACTVAQTIPVPFNDADALDARLAELSGQVACVIMEPGMMNIGVVLPQDGYLAAVREITQKHGVLLIFDEVKTGITIAAGGAVERFGVTPDIVTLAKALAGGLPSGAIGGSEEVMASIEDGTVYQVGTYNGNPLSMAAARASFQEVMTPDAYAHLEHLNDRLHDGLGAIIERHGFPAHVIGLGAKGCIVFSPEPVLNYRDWAHKTNGPLNELAWLYNMNRGVFMTPGREEEWTLSVQHDDADIDRFIDVFAELAADLTT